MQCPTVTNQSIVILTIIISSQAMSMTRSSLREQEQSAGSDLFQSHKKYAFYVFIDPYCGLGCGKSFLKLQTEKICFILDGQHDQPRLGEKQRRLKYDIHTHFYDMSCQRTMEVASERLKFSNNQKSRKVRIVVCGDESSLCHIINVCEDNDISLENIPFGIIPSGYTNDLSTVLGWGEKQSEELVGADLKYIKQLALKWVKAIPEKIDLWTVNMSVHEEDGAIQTVDRRTRLKIYDKEKQIKTCMISHLNIGVHARIDLGFDQKKSNESNVANRWIHAFEEFKKLMCMSTKISKMVTMVEIEEKNKGDSHVYRTLFTTKKPQQQEAQPGAKYLEGSPVSLVCLNIGCYRGECDVWRKADSPSSMKNTKFYNQSMYDGKLQFLTYNSVISTQGKKLCQVQGSLNINLQKQNAAYVQIDGACFKLINPKQISIDKKMKLQVLINKESLK